MKKQIYIYSIKLWLAVTCISFLLFQIPLFSIYYNNANIIKGSYFLFLSDFTISWLYITFMLLASDFFIFTCIRPIYQTHWSARGFKVALLLVALVFMPFSFVIYFFFFNSKNVVPTGGVLLVYWVSYIMGVYSINYESLLNTFYQELALRE